MTVDGTAGHTRAPAETGSGPPSNAAGNDDAGNDDAGNKGAGSKGAGTSDAGNNAAATESSERPPHGTSATDPTAERAPDQPAEVARAIPPVAGNPETNGPETDGPETNGPETNNPETNNPAGSSEVPSQPTAEAAQKLETPARLAGARAAATGAGLDALLITPGADLLFLTGYHALPLERLTCLVLPADNHAGRTPTLIVPTLERPAAEASPATATGVRIVDYGDGVSPYPLVVDALGGAVTAVAVADRMWASHVLALRAALPGPDGSPAAQRLAGPVLAPLRSRKSPTEIAALREAGAAIDAVHAAMGRWLRPWRTEAEVATDIAAAMLDSGHARVDFVIVAAGPNAASPHHETSDRVITPGEPVVVDIGGTMPSGYCSDCTRTYVAGGEPSADFLAYYDVLCEAQRAAVAAVAPGVLTGAVDAAARDPITAAGYGDAFLHRTGHGIGLDTHEEPYIVAGGTLALATGMAFSVEPGIYLAGRHGARIEDIVVCSSDGVERLNNTPTELGYLV